LMSGAPGYEPIIPWPDVARVRRWVRRSQEAQRRLAQALRG